MNANDPYAPILKHLGYPDSSRLRAILEILMTHDQAQMVAALPGTPQEVAEKTGLAVDQVQEELDALFVKGVVYPKGDLVHRKYFRPPHHVGQLHDASLATQMLDVVKDRKFFELWQDFAMNEMYAEFGNEFANYKEPFCRIVPAYKAIKDLPDVLPCEDFTELLKAQEKIAVVPCSCRYRTTSVDEHCDYTAEEERWNCLQFGRGAEYVLERGSGKELSIEEALQLMEKIEDDGLLHQWPNHTSTSGVNTSCQCCRDCCEVFVPLDMAGVPIRNFWEKSRYLAIIDQDKCIGCQDCVDRCMFDAIEMVKPKASKQAKPKKSKRLKAMVKGKDCWGCGVCVLACQDKALTLKAVRPVEHIPVAE